MAELAKLRLLTLIERGRALRELSGPSEDRAVPPMLVAGPIRMEPSRHRTLDHQAGQTQAGAFRRSNPLGGKQRRGRQRLCKRRLLSRPTASIRKRRSPAGPNLRGSPRRSRRPSRSHRHHRWCCRRPFRSSRRRSRCHHRPRHRRRPSRRRRRPEFPRRRFPRCRCSRRQPGLPKPRRHRSPNRSPTTASTDPRRASRWSKRPQVGETGVSWKRSPSRRSPRHKESRWDPRDRNAPIQRP